VAVSTKDLVNHKKIQSTKDLIKEEDICLYCLNAR